MGRSGKLLFTVYRFCFFLLSFRHFP
jgi:hypothetical protein